MKARRSVLVQLMALGLAVGMTMVAIPLFRGSMNATGAEPVIALLPVLALVGLLAGTFRVIRGKSMPPAGIYTAFAASAILFTTEQGFVLGAAAGRMAFTLRFGLALIFGFFVGISPILARVEQNPWFGVRTPWTLGSRRVWRDTHRATAKLWFFGGILGSLFALFGAPFTLVGLYLGVLALAPIGLSYAAWLRLGRP